jgi:chromosome segregation ATPase
MSTIEEGLKLKKSELESLEQDIEKKEKEASNLKPTFVDYNQKMEAISRLKKERKKLQHEFDTVTSFFQGVDDTYLTRIFPLFDGNNKSLTGN